MPASAEYLIAVHALTDEIRQRRDAVLHRSHCHQRFSMEQGGDSTDAVYMTPKLCTLIATRVQQHHPSPRLVGFASPESGDPVARQSERTVTEPRVATESRSRRECHVSLERKAVQYRVQADGWSLRGRSTPSPQGVGRGGVRADTLL